MIHSNHISPAHGEHCTLNLIETPKYCNVQPVGHCKEIALFQYSQIRSSVPIPDELKNLLMEK